MGLRVAALVLAVMTVIMMFVFGVTAIATAGSGAGYGSADAFDAAAELQLTFEWLDQQVYELMAFSGDEEALYYMGDELDKYSSIFEEDLAYYSTLAITEEAKALYDTMAYAYYNSYNPLIYRYWEELQAYSPQYVLDDVLNDLGGAYDEIAGAASQSRKLEYDRLTFGFAGGESYSGSSVIVVVTVFALAMSPALGLLGVTIAGVVSENRRRKLWQQPVPPQYDYAPQYPAMPPQYPQDRARVEGSASWEISDNRNTTKD
jgi:hypothetical protein